VKVGEHADGNSGSRELDVAIQVEGDALSVGGGYLCVDRVATDRVAVVLLEAKPVCYWPLAEGRLGSGTKLTTFPFESRTTLSAGWIEMAPV